MSRLLVRSSLRWLARHPWQFGLSVLGVALGVAVVVAVDLVNDSARRAFRLSTEAVFGATTHQVLGPPAGLDERVYVDLRRSGLGRPAAPVLEGRAASPRHAGRGLTLLGIDPFAEAPFRTWLGSGAGGGVDGGAARALLVHPGAVLASADLAARMGVAPGERFALLANGRRVRALLAGVIRPRDELTRRGIADVLVADLATAQEILGRTGRLTRIDLIVADDAAGRARLARIRERLPPGAVIEPAGSRTRVADQMTAAFRLNLLMLSLLALVVGMFLVFNTMRFSVLQRRELIGALRAAGVTGAQITAVVLAEAAALGALGTALGLAGGLALANGLLGLVVQTINDLYFAVTVREVHVAPVSLAKGVALGTGAALAAALLPAIEATRVPPRAALARSSIEGAARRALPRTAIAGVAVLVAGGALLLVPGGGLALGFVALFAVVAGFTLLAPALTVLLVRGSAAALRAAPGGLLARVALRGIVAGLSRTGVAIAALMVALAATVGVGVMVDSFRHSVARWLETTLRADVYVSVEHSLGGSTLAESVVPRLRAVPGVEHLSLGRGVEVRTPGGPVDLVALRMAPASYDGFRIVAGDRERAWRAFDEEGAVIVSEPLAWHRDLGPGDTLALVTDRGRHAFPVAAVFRDYGTEQGVVIMSRDTYERWYEDRGHSSAGVYAAQGSDVDALVERLRAAAADLDQALHIRPNRVIREASLEVFDRTFTITVVLRLLATGIAFVGVLSALMALALERAREIAVLRATGVTGAQVWGLVGAQTGFLGLIAGLLAIPLGLVLALVLILVINRRSFGWSLEVAIDPAILAQAVALAVAAALLAGVWPAHRMSRTSPARALREE